jgi:hypothetical protein
MYRNYPAQRLFGDPLQDMSGVDGDGLAEREFAFEGEQWLLEDEPQVHAHHIILRQVP